MKDLLLLLALAAVFAVGYFAMKKVDHFLDNNYEILLAENIAVFKETNYNNEEVSLNCRSIVKGEDGRNMDGKAEKGAGPASGRNL